MKIINGRLEGVRQKPAKFSGDEISPRFIVVHDTAGRLDKFNTVRYFQKPAATVSAHFVVERDGTVTQMVRTDRKAYHAGKSAWKGVYGLNSCSIGIELVNPGKLDENGCAWFGDIGECPEIVQKSTPEHGAGFWLPYTPEQMQAVTALCRAIVETYPDCNEIVSHYDISPGRKIDPNPLFPIDSLRDAVFAPEVDDGEPELPPPVAPEKTMATSKVGGAAIAQGLGSGAVAGATILEKTADTAEKTSSSIDRIWNAAADPIVLIAFGGLCFACFFFWDRYKKKRDWGI